MHVEQNVSLRRYNAFSFDVAAEYFVGARSQTTIREALAWARRRSLPVFVLGGGNNIVLTRNVHGLVLHVDTRGITRESESVDHIELSVQAGESWHGFVEHCIDQHYFGVENLSLIPGRLGAAPIQNIGAYGVELSDRLVSLRAIDRHSGESISFNRADCDFAYRSSVFKRDLKDAYIITTVRLRLDKAFVPQAAYGEIERRLVGRIDAPPSARGISDVICEIRRSKLPDPAQLGNVGSFFTNPIVSRYRLAELRRQYSDIVAYGAGEEQCKLAAGWLIEQCGWRGYRDERVGVHVHQALVLVNHANGNGDDIMALAQAIRQSVREKFGVELRTEPVVY